MHRFVTFLLLIIFSSFILLGQEGGISIADLVKGSHISILDEKLEINIYGKENVPDAFQIKRRVIYKIHDSKGIEQIQKIQLPENLDRTYIPHAPSVKNLGVFYSGFDVEYFNVSITRKGKVVKSKVKKKVNYKESFNLDFLYEYDIYNYYIEGIQVGDEVKIDYHIDIPFRENYSRFASFRVFFHEDIPKLKYEFVLSHHRSLDIEIFGYNGAEKAYSVERERIKYHTWKYKNLAPSLLETGSRPYKELPHFTWVINHYRYYIHNSNQLQNVPHYAVIASLRSPNLYSILNALDVESTSQQYLPFNQTYDKLTKGINPDYQRIRLIHNHITEEFKYQNDKEYYQRMDNRGDRLGEFFKNGIIRDHNRYDMYYAFLVKSKEHFYTSFLIDKRFGQLSDEYFQPNFDSDFVLANYFGEKAFDFMLPKAGDFGWYYNELPFYWQDCVTRLVHISDYAAYKYPIRDQFRSTSTPISPVINNLRQINSKVLVDLDKDSLSFQTKVRLSGQYSTMCRPSYYQKNVDRSVDPLYHSAIWNIEGLSSWTSDNTLQEKEVPFAAEFDCNYKSSLNPKIDEISQLNISSWLKFILPPMKGSKRYLAYYPDFMGVDEYSYDIQFARPVKLENERLRKVTNDYAEFYIKIDQIDPNVIRLRSYLQINTEMVEAIDFDEVLEIIREVESVRKINYRIL